MRPSYGKWAFSLIAMSMTTASLAAEPVDLRHAPASTLGMMSVLSSAQSSSGFRKTSVHTDRQGTAHIRLQQTFEGQPVWGANAVLHVPELKAASRPLTALLAHPVAGTRMNGTVWRNLQLDLPRISHHLQRAVNAQIALKKAIERYEQQTGTRPAVSDTRTHSIVFVDDQNKAHWAWHIQFRTRSRQVTLAMPNFILDATTYKIYRHWNNLQTRQALASGTGGNPQIGQVIYDGLPSHLSALPILRDETSKTCYLRNDEVVVIDRDDMRGDMISQFPCITQDDTHNHTYWDGNLMEANGAWSPDNDALFIGHVIQNLYHDWYGVPALTRRGRPMKLVMRVHDYELPNNAFWDGQQMTFSDGGDEFYPFTILGIGAHEISHGFTEQHSNLVYFDQSGGLNESFSDMAGAAADFYAYGKNNWGVGGEISKAGDGPFRYMDQPSRDCERRRPGRHCSIDRASQYHCTVDQQGDKYCLDVHYSSGVFNRAFYLLATSSDWDIHKAFDVMVKANQDYWVSTSTFQQAACDVMSAASDLKYDTEAVHKALLEVDLDTAQC